MKTGIVIVLIVCIFGLLLIQYRMIHQEPQILYVQAQPALDENNDSLILAIIRVESNFNKNARSKCNAVGLMQVRYKIWKHELKTLGINSEKELMNPNNNIKAGKYILGRYLRETKGDLREALHRYSGGAKGYYHKVMKAYQE